jgi:hypothetical protein
MEKSYDYFSKLAKKGINKFTRLSSKSMKQYGECFDKKTGRNSYNVGNKEEFYEFVAKNKIKGGSCGHVKD